MAKLRGVVLDKSYLQAAPYKEVHALCRRYQAGMPDVLFFELMSDDECRSRCFRKLPDVESPLKLLPSVGELMKFEIESNKPCGKPSKRALAFRYRFNKDLAAGTFSLTREQTELVAEQVSDLRHDVDGLIERVETVATMFPDLLRGTDADRKAFKNEVERTIASDRKALLTFYAGLEAPAGERPLPAPSRLKSNWAIYRWLQVNLLMGVDLLYRYKLTLKVPGVLTAKLATHLEHEILDSHYVITGALEGALATRDANVRRLWNLVKPDALLIPRSLSRA